MNTWILKDPGGVEIKKFTPVGNQPAGLVNLMRSVSMTFVQVDEAGMPTGADPHVYTEPNVVNLTDEGIARLIRDQLNQLNLVESKAPLGLIADLSSIKALVSPPPPEKLSDEEQAEFNAVNEKRDTVLRDLQKQRQLINAVSLGLLKDDDADVVAARERLKAAIADDPSLVLSALG